jgi:hypothetical protein
MVADPVDPPLQNTLVWPVKFKVGVVHALAEPISISSKKQMLLHVAELAVILILSTSMNAGFAVNVTDSILRIPVPDGVVAFKVAPGTATPFLNPTNCMGFDVQLEVDTPHIRRLR